MSLTMNKSSDSVTQSNILGSFFNKSQIDDVQYNSFSSPRSDSVTVIGRKLCSQSCIAICEEKTKFPVAIQAVNRIYRQKVQAKVLLKRKREKIKVQDQPAPVPRPVIKVVCSIPQVCKEKVKKKKKAKEKSVLFEKTKILMPQTERSNVRMNQILKKSAIFEVKKKKKEMTLKLSEQKKQVVKKIRLKEKNSQIRAENFVKFKKEKFSPKFAWGVDERKIIENEKVLKDIEAQRKTQNAKVSDIRKKPQQFNKFVEFGEDFKPRSSSNPIERVKPVFSKESKKELKNFIKNQRKKEKEKKENQIIEEIQKETKRIISLKGLESKVVKSKKSKKINERLKVQFRPKKIGFPQDSEDEIARIYADKSSEFLFEPESHMREEVSAFSEDSIEVKQSPDFSHISAAIKIQYHFRKFLKALHSPTTFHKTAQKSQHRSESFPSSTQETVPKPDETLNKEERNSEILQNEAKRQFSDDLSLNDSLSEGISNHCQTFTDSLQSTGKIKSSLKVDSENNENKTDHEKNSKTLEFSLDSDISGSDSSEDRSGKNDGLSKTEVSSEKDEKTDGKSVRKVQLVSRASPISESSSEEFCESLHSKPLISAVTITGISEALISLLIQEISNFEEGVKKTESIEKDPTAFINQLVFHIPQSDFKANLSKPIRKNPLEILAKLQTPDTYLTKTFDALSTPPIIPVSTFNDIESFKLENFSNKDLYEAQKVHDKLVFDNCNEILQKYRPYAAEGFPLPWSSAKRVMRKFSHDAVEILPKLVRKLEVLSLFEAGKVGSEENEEALDVPQSQMQNSREEKIGFMILQDIRKKEGLWTDYEYEETQTVIDLANYVFEEVVIETLLLA